MIKYFLSILLLGSTAFAAGGNVSDNILSKISSEEKDGKTYIHFMTSKSIDAANIEARFLRRSVEWDLAGIGIKKDKLFVDIGSNDVNNVYVSYSDEKNVRVRVNLDNGKMASNYHDRISFHQDNAGLTMILDSSIKLISNDIKELNRTYDIATSNDTKIAEHMSTASVLKVGAVASPSSEDEDMVTLDDTKAEDQIPLKLKNNGAKVASSQPLSRMLIGLLAVGLVLGSLVVIGRKVNRKRLGAQFNQDSITVVSQKYLGPKRNLTLVRVSGEYLLLGVTDNNISLIKTLSIVDDEIPALTPNDFGKAVKDMSAKADSFDDMVTDVEDSFAVSSLNDVKKMFKKRKYIDE